MIYASSSTVVNTNHKTLWKTLLHTSTHLEDYSPDIEEFSIDEDHYDGLMRSYIADSYKLQERVYQLKEARKVIWRLNEHPVYFGETILHILCPDDEMLADKKVTLNAVLAWRIHPGVIATPHLDKQQYLNILVQNIASNAEKDSALRALIN